MSRAKPKAIWVVMANSRPVAVFADEDTANKLCLELNASDQHRRTENLKYGLNLGRTYYTWVKLTVGGEIQH